MKLVLRAQMELFAPPAQLLRLASSEREKALTLLRMLLMEAVADPAPASPNAGEGDVGDE